MQRKQPRVYAWKAGKVGKLAGQDAWKMDILGIKLSEYFDIKFQRDFWPVFWDVNTVAALEERGY